MKTKINSRVENGVLIRNRKSLNKAIQEFNGKDVLITIEKKRKVRSTMQNSYYWGVIVSLIQLAIKEEWQDKKSKDQVHELLKRELNFVERVNHQTGEIIKDAKSTTENSTTEQEVYHEDCRRWAKEWFNIEVPLPSEQIEIEL